MRAAVLVLLLGLFAGPLTAQTATAAGSPAFADEAVQTVASTQAPNVEAKVASTGAPISTAGKWGLSATRPVDCPAGDVPCVDVVYTADGVQCRWTVEQEGESPAIIAENAAAGLYFLREATAQEATERILSKPQVLYPPLARAAHQVGTVRIAILVTPEGRVAAERLVNGPPMLQVAALDGIRNWKLSPWLVGGTPISWTAEVGVTFSLSSPFFAAQAAFLPRTQASTVSK